jgi:uncharacterized damage-inducible protein DinB
MSRKLGFAAALVLAVPAGAQAQGPTQDPLISSTRFLYEQVRGFVTSAAEQMPEEHYSFRPVESVRTFGQLVGHVANAQYMFCNPAVGGANPNSVNIEETATTKAELVAALKTAFAYCDRAYNTLTDAQGTEIVRFFGAERPKMFSLNFNVAHNMEHYGNMVTYMRIKGLTPPSSQRGN